MGKSCSPGVMFLIASFVLSVFPRDVLDEIWDLIELVSEGFPIYSLYQFWRSEVKKAFLSLQAMKLPFETPLN